MSSTFSDKIPSIFAVHEILPNDFVSGVSIEAMPTTKKKNLALVTAFMPSKDRLGIEIPQAHLCKDLVMCDYGVADNLEQVIDYIADTDLSQVTHVEATVIENEGPEELHGWRWGEWGKYIGTQNHQHEYLNDEDEELIPAVIIFTLYKPAYR